MNKTTIICLAIAALALAACDKKKNELGGKLDPNATILLKAAKGVTLRDANPEHLTALEIVKQTTNIKFKNEPIFGEQSVGRGFSSEQRDYDTPALKMFATDIINTNGEYVPDFIEATDCVLQRLIQETPIQLVDTIAYIPNATLHAAKIAVKAAYDKKDYEECYRLFHEAFTFIPITGEEWRVLKASGKQ